MEKETVTKFNLEAAFKALDEIDMPKAPKGRLQANRVNLHERFQAKSAHDRLIEDYFDVNDVDDLEAAKEEREAEVDAAVTKCGFEKIGAKHEKGWCAELFVRKSAK